jgi:hypothetical protein
MVAVAVAACAARPAAEFAVAGESGAVARLAGTWEGTYASPMLGRAGSITLTFGEGQARGDVIMVPPGQTRPVGPASPSTRQSLPPGAPPPPPAAAVLAIDFVQAAGDSITGTMAPYHDPDCQCTVQATFTGRLDGDTIRGTFVSTRTLGDQRVAGTWEVRRRR